LSEGSDDTQFALKVSDIVRKELYRMYALSGDRDYLGARLMFTSGLSSNFPWPALQCIEKYLKAGLFLRDIRSAKLQKTHDIVKLFQRIRRQDDFRFRDNISDLPQLWGRPSLLLDVFGEELSTIEEFLSNISEMGHTDSRYGERDHLIDIKLLLEFDLVARALRQDISAVLPPGWPTLQPFAPVSEFGFFKFWNRSYSQQLFDSFSRLNLAYLNDTKSFEETQGGLAMGNFNTVFELQAERSPDIYRRAVKELWAITGSKRFQE
jgi:HEPN domain-containing protein